MESGKGNNVIIKLLSMNPWFLLLVFTISLVFALIAFMSNIKSLNYKLPSYDKLQYVEGTVENFDFGPGRNNIFFELVLTNKETYYLNQHIAYYKGLPQVIQKGSNVKFYIDNSYKNSFPNQIYEMEIDGNMYLSYKDSCEFLLSYYADGIKNGDRLIIVAFVACAYVCISFAVQLLRKR